MVKGVLRGDDARRCVDCGVKGVMVSNHGGRHLDTTVTTAEVLSEIVAEVGGSAEVYVDGGIRRGTDIVKALALGARAVLLGRPPLWGLSVAGADGVAAVLKHMREELVRAMQLCGAASLCGADARSGGGMKELIPTGKLRFGVAFAPKTSALFVVKEEDGSPRGITADLGSTLAKRLGVPVEFMVAPNTGVLTDALADAKIDVAFMPVDDERKKRLDFGPMYALVESTYMVTAASGIKTLAEVDRPGVRVVGIANTTTIRAAGRTLKNIQPIAATSIDDALAMLRGGKADAFALSGTRCRISWRCFPARISSTAASSRPASPSRCRRAGRPRWPM